MKRTIAASLIALLLLASAGCGGGDKDEARDGLSLLMEASQAMLEVSGYRMSGTVGMEVGAPGGGGQGQAMTVDLTADVQNADDGMRQRMLIDMGGYEVEAYIIGGVYYQNVPGQGWTKTSTGAYLSQGMNLGVVDAEQMEMMADMAEDIEVVEESDEVFALSFRLDQEYAQAVMDLYRKYVDEQDEGVSEEWLSMAEEAMADFHAELRIWLNRADKLMRRMEMSYVMGGMSEIGEVTSSMEVDLFDYGEDIVVELPAEAAQAQEIELAQ